MKQLCIYIILIFSYTLSSSAQIVYIDMNYILNQSEIGKSLNNYINKENDEYLIKYKKIEDKLVEKENQLLAQKNIILKSEFEEKLKDLSNEIKKYRSNKKITIEKINIMKLENTKKILKILNPIITKFVNDNSISLVVPKKNIIVGKKDLDITYEIIDLLNIEAKTLDF